MDDQVLDKVRCPSRYIGNEVNAVKKALSSVDVTVALAFPDIYEVGMSHQGLKILYNILNGPEWLAAERVYSPWTDMEEELRKSGNPLSTLESGRCLGDFDILGFSLQHELSYTNVLTMLDLSGIPFLSEDRDDSFPLIIAGGPACFNPEPIADIFDVVVIGDGEEVFLDICESVRRAKTANMKKTDILQRLSEKRGIYIPSLFKVHYLPGGVVEYIEPIIPEYRDIEKAVVSDINRHPFPVDQVVPFTELVHDRLAIEISRGCSRGCRFCQAGMIYRPVRERDPQSIIESLDRALKLTGFEEMSLLSLSSGDYSHIGDLIKELMNRQSEKKIAISLPSLRIDTLDPAWFEQIKRVRKTGFTMAPEAGSDRLRRILNKSLTNRVILETAQKVYEAGWNLIKLYFMIGLPGEEEKDLKDIASLAGRVASLAGQRNRKKPVLNIHLSTFVPKSHTPFMWTTQISLAESRRRIGYIRNQLKGNRSIRVKWNQPELSWLEGIFSRGDRRLITPLVEAWKMGARFDAWGENFAMDIWLKALESSDLDPDFYLNRSRSVNEVLPWDHIRSGVTKEFFRREWERALSEKHTPDCRKQCLECGVCNHRDIDPRLCEEWSLPSSTGKPFPDRSEGVKKKYRLTFSKTGYARYLSHLELSRVFIRAIRRAGLKIAFSEGYHPMPKLSFPSALPVGTESVHETVDLELYENTEAHLLKKELNLQLPEGIWIVLAEDISLKKRGRIPVETHYRIGLNGLTVDPSCLERFLDSEFFPIEKRSSKGNRDVDARSLVKSLSFISPGALSLVIRHIPGPEIRPIQIVKEIFQIRDDDLLHIKILKIKEILG